MKHDRGITIHFTDGTSLGFEFPQQADNKYARQIMTREIGYRRRAEEHHPRRNGARVSPGCPRGIAQGSRFSPGDLLDFGPIPFAMGRMQSGWV